MKSIRFNRSGRSLAGALFAAFALGLLPSAQAQSSSTNAAPAPMPRRSSIIVIQAEGLGFGDLSCYGQTKFQTPNLDRLAAEGIRFTNYYAGGTASSPSRAALLTGKDAKNLRQRTDVDIALAPNETSVAQILQQSGYHTGLIGEWNLGDETTGGAPWKKGFEEFAGYFDKADAENFYADYIWRYAPKCVLNPTNNLLEDYIGREMLFPNTGGKKGQYTPDVFAKATVNFIQNNVPDQFNHYRPFFLLVNYKIPGTSGKITVPTDAPFSSEAWPQPEKNKAAIIARLDGYIGQLLEQLEKSRLTNNVAIFFTSDTVAKKAGGVDPQFFQSNLSTNDARVPMIVRWPGKIPAGKVNGFAWTASDFLPTAMDIALAKPLEKIDGVSVLPVLSGQTQTNLHKFLKN
jgi:arylsulfatase A-like enzyme